MIKALQNPCTILHKSRCSSKQKLLNDFTKFLNLPENKALVGKAFL
jgi:hypothetical protein